jgi:hypothetical protein
MSHLTEITNSQGQLPSRHQSNDTSHHTTLALIRRRKERGPSVIVCHQAYDRGHGQLTPAPPPSDPTASKLPIHVPPSSLFRPASKR